MVGTSGITLARLLALTASAMSLPSRKSGSVVVNSCRLKSIRSATTSVTASAAPLKAMCCASIPALTRRRSAAKCEADPTPADE